MTHPRKSGECSVQRSLRRILAGLLCLATAVLHVHALAHSQLVTTVPEDGALLGRPPPAVVIRFSKPAKIARFELHRNDPGGEADEDGEPVEIGGDFLMQENSEHVIALPELPPGTYTVRWRALSQDGHIVKNQSRFTVSSFE